MGGPGLADQEGGVELMRGTPEQRFWAKVDVRGPDECWPWIGGVTGTGHGVFWIGARLIGAHVYAYELANGPVPVGLDVGHRCHDLDLKCAGGVTCLHRRCVNDRHLEAQTRLMNLQGGRGTSRAQTRCKWDHEFTPENTRWTSRGARQCIACCQRRAREGKVLRVDFHT